MKYTYEYPRPCVTVDCIIFRTGREGWEVLLIRRANAPYKGQWAFPGGFVNMDETLEEAAERELKEETGLSGISLSQLGAFSAVDRDPRTRTIAVAFTGLAGPDLPQPEGMDDADEADWFDLKDLPALAFDHADMLAHALRRIK